MRRHIPTTLHRARILLLVPHLSSRDSAKEDAEESLRCLHQSGARAVLPARPEWPAECPAASTPQPIHTCRNGRPRAHCPRSGAGAPCSPRFAKARASWSESAAIETEQAAPEGTASTCVPTPESTPTLAGRPAEESASSPGAQAPRRSAATSLPRTSG